MKKMLFVLLIGITSAATAQEEPQFTIPRTTVKLSPLYFFSNTFELGLEAFNANFDKSFNVDLGFRSGAADYYDGGTGFNMEVAYRKYVAPMKMHQRKTREFYQGIYYSIFLRGETFKGSLYNYDYGTGGYDVDENRVNTISPGFTLGLQKTLWQIVFLDVYVGGGIKMSDAEQEFDPYYYDIGVTEPGYKGIFPKIGVKIGVGL